jgi:hypothetical protein
MFDFCPFLQIGGGLVLLGVFACVGVMVLCLIFADGCRSAIVSVERCLLVVCARVWWFYF